MLKARGFIYGSPTEFETKKAGLVYSEGQKKVYNKYLKRFQEIPVIIVEAEDETQLYMFLSNYLYWNYICF